MGLFLHRLWCTTVKSKWTSKGKVLSKLRVKYGYGGLMVEGYVALAQWCSSFYVGGLLSYSVSTNIIH